MPASPSSTPTFRSTMAGRQGVILAMAVITAVLTGPGQTIGVSVFINSFITDLHLSRSQVSWAYMFGTLTASLMLPLVGARIDRYGVRRAQIVIGIFFAAALVNMSMVNSLVWLAIGFVGIRFLGQGSLSLVAVLSVSLSFKRFRGTALGLHSTLAGGLMVLTPLVLTFSIHRIGWRYTWVAAAAAIAVTVVPIALFAMRDPAPANPDSQESDVDETELNGVSHDRSSAIRTKGFWIVAAVSGSASMLVTALNFHQIDILTNAGLSEGAAAALFIPQIAGSTAAGLTFGWLADRVGTRALPTASMVLLVVVHLLASVVNPGLTVVIYAVALGSVGGAARTVSSVLLPEWFGTANLGSIQGTLTLIGVAASAIGPLALALTQEWFDAYRPAVLLLAIIPVLAGLFALQSPRTATTTIEV